MKSKKMNAPIDVVGRKISWKPRNSDRLYATVSDVELEHYVPVQPLYPDQRHLRKLITVDLYDGRQMRFRAEEEDIKRMGIVPE